MLTYAHVCSRMLTYVVRQRIVFDELTNICKSLG
jgi:hypothetical protein